MVRSRKRPLPCSVAHTVLCGSLVLLVVPEVVLLGLPLELDYQRWFYPTGHSERVHPPRREAGAGVGVSDSQPWLYRTRQSGLLVHPQPRRVCVGDSQRRLCPRPSERVQPLPREAHTGDSDRNNVTASVGDTLGDTSVVGVGVGVDDRVGDSVVRRQTRSFAVGAPGGRSSSRIVGDTGRRRTSFAVGAAVVSNIEPFVDDGMFDPRRDYWGDRSKGSTSSASTTHNWASATRGLASTSSNCGTASSSEPCCIECFGLSYCDVLNGYKVEDKYYPGEPTVLGSCENVEERASRLDVFGASKTFRDTEACREMVADYTCLWWGSDNEMYDNRCGVEAQVYPCRSYCVQLAKTCANNVVEWLELCRSIDCPPTSEECMPGPYTQDPDEACYLYEYHSPLNVGARTPSAPGTKLAILVASAMGTSLLWRATYGTM